MEFDVRITKALLRRVLLKRLFGRWRLLLVAVGLLAVGLYSKIDQGRLDTFVGLGLASIGFLTVLYGALYIGGIRNIAEWQRLQGDAPVHYQLTMEGLTATSNLGRSDLRWLVFSELLEHPAYLLLGMASGGHLTLPRSDIPSEALEFIRERFTSHNLPVKKA
jgi:hypothetical protein